MNNEPDEPNDLDRHHRNLKAIAYLDALKAREARQEKARFRVAGAAFVLLITAILWFAIFTIVSALNN